MKTEQNDIINAFEETDGSGGHYHTHITLDHLTVKDLGDIVEASFESEGCRVVVKIRDNTLREYDIYTNQTAHTLRELVESYLKQNLK